MRPSHPITCYRGHTGWLRFSHPSHTNYLPGPRQAGRSYIRPTERRESARVKTPVACLGFPTSPGLVEETMLANLAQRLQTDLDRPRCHVAPRSGWMNDPNGPVYVDGEYHVFFQHITEGCEWDFGIVWGHVVSKDLIHWEHMADALNPSQGCRDQDGCFSGCAVVDTDGTPTILYTGVRLRSRPCSLPAPPSECDLHLPFIETQLVATAHADDSSLETWVKQETPIIELPPVGEGELVGWRDPYIFETVDSQNQKEWGMLLGTGIKDQGGSVLIYRSKNLREGWRYDGKLCESDDKSHGLMWECPILVELNQVSDHPGQPSRIAVEELSRSFNNQAVFNEATTDDSARSSSVIAANDPRDAAVPSDSGVEAGSVLGSSGRPVVEPTSEDVNPASTSGQEHHTHFLCISPDKPTNPTQYWIGDFDARTTKFSLDDAKGPLRLDLGDVLYAPNLMVDEKGRHIMWGWLQERRTTTLAYDYAGCLSVPRLIYKRGDRLIQEPAPELAGLREGTPIQFRNLEIPDEESVGLHQVTGPSAEVQVTFDRGSANAAGILIRSWTSSGRGSAAIFYDWDTRKTGAIFERDEKLVPDNDGDRPPEVGGPVDLRDGEKLQMRLILDGSCVECYFGSGEVLSTRVYRGTPTDDDPGIELVSFGGTAFATHVQAWKLKSIWQGDPRMNAEDFQYTADDIEGPPIPA